VFIQTIVLTYLELTFERGT